jgi:hypothetical protein
VVGAGAVIELDGFKRRVADKYPTGPTIAYELMITPVRIPLPAPPKPKPKLPIQVEASAHVATVQLPSILAPYPPTTGENGGGCGGGGGGGRAGGEMIDLGGRMLLGEGPMGEESHLRVPRGATPGQTVNMRIPISPRDYR